ncbi:hypothetical protein HK105_200607 [Polyrhizophydium stewartii]|uniref:Uncharacterized protein n=1 Tax=Polyrhizophydium stewartii TaxID=2732419 RepID=A0ABR4NJI7_9FUNG
MRSPLVAPAGPRERHITPARRAPAPTPGSVRVLHGGVAPVLLGGHPAAAPHRQVAVVPAVGSHGAHVLVPALPASRARPLAHKRAVVAMDASPLVKVRNRVGGSVVRLGARVADDACSHPNTPAQVSNTLIRQSALTPSPRFPAAAEPLAPQAHTHRQKIRKSPTSPPLKAPTAKKPRPSTAATASKPLPPPSQPSQKPDEARLRQLQSLLLEHHRHHREPYPASKPSGQAHKSASKASAITDQPTSAVQPLSAQAAAEPAAIESRGSDLDPAHKPTTPSKPPMSSKSLHEVSENNSPNRAADARDAQRLAQEKARRDKAREYMKEKRARDKLREKQLAEESQRRQERIAEDLRKIEIQRRKQRESVAKRAVRVVAPDEGESATLAVAAVVLEPSAPTMAPAAPADPHVAAASIESSHPKDVAQTSQQPPMSSIVQESIVATLAAEHPHPSQDIHQAGLPPLPPLPQLPVKAAPAVDKTAAASVKHQSAPAASHPAQAIMSKDIDAQPVSSTATPIPQPLALPTGMDFSTTFEATLLEQQARSAPTRAPEPQHAAPVSTQPPQNVEQILKLERLLENTQHLKERLNLRASQSRLAELSELDSFADDESEDTTHAAEQASLKQVGVVHAQMPATLARDVANAPSAPIQSGVLAAPAVPPAPGVKEATDGSIAAHADAVGVDSLAAFSVRNVQKAARERAAIVIQTFFRRYAGPSMRRRQVPTASTSSRGSPEPGEQSAVARALTVMSTSAGQHPNHADVPLLPTPQAARAPSQPVQSQIGSATHKVQLPMPRQSLAAVSEDGETPAVEWDFGYLTRPPQQHDDLAMLSLFARRISTGAEVWNQDDAETNEAQAHAARPQRVESGVQVEPDSPVLPADHGASSASNHEPHDLRVAAADAKPAGLQADLSRAFDDVELSDDLDSSSDLPISVVQIGAGAASSAEVSATGPAMDEYSESFEDADSASAAIQAHPPVSAKRSPVAHPAVLPMNSASPAEPEAKPNVQTEPMPRPRASTPPPRPAAARTAVDSRAELMDHPDGRLTPNSLSRKLEADIQLLVALQEADVQITELDKNRSVARAQGEQAALMQLLRERQRQHELDLERARAEGMLAAARAATSSADAATTILNSMATRFDQALPVRPSETPSRAQGTGNLESRERRSSYTESFASISSLGAGREPLETPAYHDALSPAAQRAIDIADSVLDSVAPRDAGPIGASDSISELIEQADAAELGYNHRRGETSASVADEIEEMIRGSDTRSRQASPELAHADDFLHTDQIYTEHGGSGVLPDDLSRRSRRARAAARSNIALIRQFVGTTGSSSRSSPGTPKWTEELERSVLQKLMSDKAAIDRFRQFERADADRHAGKAASRRTQKTDKQTRRSANDGGARRREAPLREPKIMRHAGERGRRRAPQHHDDDTSSVSHDISESLDIVSTNDDVSEVTSEAVACDDAADTVSDDIAESFSETGSSFIDEDIAEEASAGREPTVPSGTGAADALALPKQEPRPAASPYDAGTPTPRTTSSTASLNDLDLKLKFAAMKVDTSRKEAHQQELRLKRESVKELLAQRRKMEELHLQNHSIRQELREDLEEVLRPLPKLPSKSPVPNAKASAPAASAKASISEDIASEYDASNADSIAEDIQISAALDNGDDSIAESLPMDHVANDKSVSSSINESLRRASDDVSSIAEALPSAISRENGSVAAPNASEHGQSAPTDAYSFDDVSSIHGPPLVPQHAALADYETPYPVRAPEQQPGLSGTRQEPSGSIDFAGQSHRQADSESQHSSFISESQASFNAAKDAIAEGEKRVAALKKQIAQRQIELQEKARRQQELLAQKIQKQEMALQRKLKALESQAAQIEREVRETERSIAEAASPIESASPPPGQAVSPAGLAVFANPPVSPAVRLLPEAEAAAPKPQRTSSPNISAAIPAAQLPAPIAASVAQVEFDYDDESFAELSIKENISSAAPGLASSTSLALEPQAAIQAPSNIGRRAESETEAPPQIATSAPHDEISEIDEDIPADSDSVADTDEPPLPASPQTREAVEIASDKDAAAPVAATLTHQLPEPERAALVLEQPVPAAESSALPVTPTDSLETAKQLHLPESTPAHAATAPAEPPIAPDSVAPVATAQDSHASISEDIVEDVPGDDTDGAGDKSQEPDEDRSALQQPSPAAKPEEDLASLLDSLSEISGLAPPAIPATSHSPAADVAAVAAPLTLPIDTADAETREAPIDEAGGAYDSDSFVTMDEPLSTRSIPDARHSEPPRVQAAHEPTLAGLLQDAAPLAAPDASATGIADTPSHALDVSQLTQPADPDVAMPSVPPVVDASLPSVQEVPDYIAGVFAQDISPDLDKTLAEPAATLPLSIPVQDGAVRQPQPETTMPAQDAQPSVSPCAFPTPQLAAHTAESVSSHASFEPSAGTGLLAPEKTATAEVATPPLSAHETQSVADALVVSDVPQPEHIHELSEPSDQPSLAEERTKYSQETIDAVAAMIFEDLVQSSLANARSTTTAKTEAVANIMSALRPDASDAHSHHIEPPSPGLPTASPAVANVNNEKPKATEHETAKSETAEVKAAMDAQPKLPLDPSPPAPTSADGIGSMVDQLLLLADPPPPGLSGYAQPPFLSEAVLDQIQDTEDPVLRDVGLLVFEATNEAIAMQFKAHQAYEHPLRPLIRQQSLRPRPVPAHALFSAVRKAVVDEWAGYSDIHQENLDALLIREVKESEKAWRSTDLVEAQIKLEIEAQLWDSLLEDTAVTVDRVVALKAAAARSAHWRHLD